MTDELTPLPANAPWWAKWLVDNYKTIWKDASSWCFALVAFLASLGEVIPIIFADADHSYDKYIHWAIVGSAAAGYIVKYIRQRPEQ